MEPRRRTVVVVLAGVYFTFLGLLSGIAVERIRFDVHRTAIVTRLTAAEQRVHAYLMDLEGRSGRRSTPVSRASPLP